jgi:cytochrome c5
MKVTFTFKPPAHRPGRRVSGAIRAEICAVLAVLAAGITACGAVGAVPPVASDARWANERWPGTTVEELAHGRDVFVSRCSSCHGLPRPDVKSHDEWASVLDEMAVRAKLSSDDRDLVLRYLSATSQRLRAANGATPRAVN